MTRFWLTLPGSVALLFATSAAAVVVAPTSYTMVNGFAGTFTYFDDSYTGLGCKTCAGALLSQGLGDLTDGVIATQDWNVTPGPYVGWNGSPTITFFFGQVVSIDSVTMYFDDSGGAGGVRPPIRVNIGSQSFNVVDPPGSDPFALTVSGLNFSGSSLNVTPVRSGSNITMLSEVVFQSSAVPEIPTPMMWLAGLATLMVGLGSRSRRHASAVPSGWKGIV